MEKCSYVVYKGLLIVQIPHSVSISDSIAIDSCVWPVPSALQTNRAYSSGAVSQGCPGLSILSLAGFRWAVSHFPQTRIQEYTRGLYTHTLIIFL